MTHEARNAKRARTGFSDQTGPWYKLDNAATIMPAVTTRRNTTLFRLSVTLDHPVKLVELEGALEKTVSRFPYFLVSLRRGFFWYYFQPLTVPVRPISDLGQPCVGHDIRVPGAPLFRVRLRDRTIACEFSHVLTDGTGGTTFLRVLLVEYFRRCGTVSEVSDLGFSLDGFPDPEEYEDAYHRFYKPGVPVPSALPQVFHLESPLIPHPGYRVISGVIPLDAVLAQAKARHVSMTEFLAAVYIESLLAIRASYVERKKRVRPVISLEIPINMRRFYPTKTLRNFSLFILPSVDSRLGAWTLEQLVSYVHHYMGIENDERRIATQISRNAGGSRKLVVRMIPLFIKDFFARILFVALGEGLVSGFLSNLGPLILPPEISGHVERVDFVGAPSQGIGTHASIVSLNGNLYLGFGSLLQSRDLERLFFSRLAALGLPVHVDCEGEA